MDQARDAMNAQNQHYVPKFILRQFLSDEVKEQVAVYDKHRDKQFVTSIRNIMAERRYNDFSFGDDWMISFEQIACRIEDMVLPRYSAIVANRKLEGTPQERADLAFLIAFQMLRSKAHREMFLSLEQQIREKVEAIGGRMEDIEGWVPATDDQIKKTHLTSIRESIGKFANIIAEKDFFLADCTPTRQFYLGDNPVSLHNSQTFGPYGNLGLALPGIEIYMPLASNLMLCAWCPTILPQNVDRVKRARVEAQQLALAEVMARRITPAQMKASLESIEPLYQRAETLLAAVKSGVPVMSNDETMDFYNSLQMGFAHRYVVSKQADFDLAKRHNAEFPQLRRGKMPVLG